jgi:Holliday junction resolvase RusA-like endonuclease
MNLHIRLPKPPQELHPNHKCHPMLRSRLTRKARTNARLLSLVALDRRPAPYWTKVQIRVTWWFKVDRRRDERNLDGWLKAYVDGIVDAGIMIDDSPTVVEWLPTWTMLGKSSTDEVLFTIIPINGQATENRQ